MEYIDHAQSDVLRPGRDGADRGGAFRGSGGRATSRRAGSAVVWFSVATFLLATSGCIFSPREPDGPPDEGSEIPWITPTHTDAVLTNLAAALAGEGVSNYMSCFRSDDAGGFEFHVDPQDSLDAGTEGYDRYALWGRADEETYVTGVFLDSAEGITVSFTTVEEPDEGQDDTYRKEDYVLTIVWQSGDHQPGEPVTYRGRATIYLRRDDTELWSIYEWVDRRADNPAGSDTWGVLRGDYRE